MKNYSNVSKIVTVLRYFLYVALLMLVACKTISVIDKTKELHAAGEYDKVAKTDINCNSGDKGCNQLHLLKGDASASTAPPSPGSKDQPSVRSARTK